MTDSHCHLDYCENLEIAADTSLAALVTVGTTVERSKKSVALSEAFPNVWAAAGIHPNNASDAQDEGVREAIAALAAHPRVVAIGETGFDTYWDKETLAAQREAFVWQVSLAERLDKAVILHVRDKQGGEEASQTAVEMLKEVGYQKGILHCFNAHQGLLETGMELGWMVSFAGNLTYKNAKRLHEVAVEVPHERLLVETDSPYLTPVPHRGKRNVPANVRHTAAFLAELRGETLETVEAYTDANAERVYGFSA